MLPGMGGLAAAQMFARPSVTIVLPNASGLLAESEVMRIAQDAINNQAMQSNGFNNFTIGGGDTNDFT